MTRLVVLVVTALGTLLAVGSIAPGVAPVAVTSPASGSMSPTAETHSLVVVVDGDPAVGDVALYETSNRDRPVLHRLVDTTDDEEAFLTRGDANEFTDQETGDPPVPRSDIYSTVPTVAGQPLVVPYAGVVLTNPAVGFGLWALLGLSLLYTTTGGAAVRETVASVPLRLHMVLAAVVLMIAFPLVTAGMPVTIETAVLTTTTAQEEPAHIVQPGETGERRVSVSSPAPWSVHAVAHADGALSVTDVEAEPGGGNRVTVENEPSDTPGVQRGTVTVHSYPAILPRSVVASLAAIHPAVAGFATSLPIAGSLLLAALLTTDPRLPIRASRRVISRRRRSRTPDSSRSD